MGIIQDIKKAVVPDGDYVIEIVPGSAVESFDRAGESVRFEIEIVDGDRRGVRIPIRFLLRGNERTAGIAGRDCSVFLKWADCLGVEDADTPSAYSHPIPSARQRKNCRHRGPRLQRF